MFKTIEWRDNKVIFIDQTRLPQDEIYIMCRTYLEVAEAIKTMIVRGAPAIGVAAAMGVALGARQIKATNLGEFSKKMEGVFAALAETRPTAVNLRWALDRMRNCLGGFKDVSIQRVKRELVAEANRILTEDIETNRRIGDHGEHLISNDDCVLTHCNAGALATAGFGTALGVLYAAKEKGKKFSVLADETRPFLQGARLTAWELQKNNIPVTLITDNTAGWMMKKGEISKVIVGADRIAANGDVANKIGTYTVAVLAKEHGLPFYVAAPTSTIDLKIKSGEEIPIEERHEEEITHVHHQRVAPQKIRVRNPAFDVTPHSLVSAIITEKGIVKEPYETNLKRLFDL